MKKTIMTIGSSSLAWPEFIARIEAAEIGCIIDVRSFPRSRLLHFNQPQLRTCLNGRGVTEAAVDLLRHSLAANTERAYESDLRHFRDWGGSIPANVATICAYIADFADSLSVATIQRRVATLTTQRVETKEGRLKKLIVASAEEIPQSDWEDGVDPLRSVR